MELENIVVYNFEVVNQLDAQIAASLYVILHVDKPVDFNLDGEAIRGELSRYLFIDFDKHVVGALYDTFLALLLTNAVR